MTALNKRAGTVYCLFCKKGVPTDDFKDHETSELHQTFLKKKLADISIGAMMCKACLVPINSEVIWKSHSNGKNHKKQVNFMNNVGKTERYQRPFSLIKFDKESSDLVSDAMFSVVPDLFAPLIEEQLKFVPKDIEKKPQAQPIDTKKDKAAVGNSESTAETKKDSEITNVKKCSDPSVSAGPDSNQEKRVPEKDKQQFGQHLVDNNRKTTDDQKKQSERPINDKRRRSRFEDVPACERDTQFNNRNNNRFENDQKFEKDNRDNNRNNNRFENDRKFEKDNRDNNRNINRSENDHNFERDNRDNNRDNNRWENDRNFDRDMRNNRGRNNSRFEDDRADCERDSRMNNQGNNRFDDDRVDCERDSRMNNRGNNRWADGPDRERDSRMNSRNDRPMADNFRGKHDRKRDNQGRSRQTEFSPDRPRFGSGPSQTGPRTKSPPGRSGPPEFPKDTMPRRSSGRPLLNNRPPGPNGPHGTRDSQSARGSHSHPGSNHSSDSKDISNGPSSRPLNGPSNPPLAPSHGAMFQSIDPYEETHSSFEASRSGLPVFNGMPPKMSQKQNKVTQKQWGMGQNQGIKKQQPEEQYPVRGKWYSLKNLPLPVKATGEELANTVDNTPQYFPVELVDPEDVEIYIPDLFADRYLQHPHQGRINANADIALLDVEDRAIKAEEEAMRAAIRANEPVPISIHLTMTTNPILKLNEDVKEIDPELYPSLRKQIKPEIKDNEKFVVIGANCLKVTGPYHFYCELCSYNFTDATKSEHLLAKSHLLNILWNWDPDSAQLIKDIEAVNKPLFEKKCLEAAREIQKKEVKLLNELQLRVRARILDDNIEDQDRYFVKNAVYDPANFPDHDFSYLNEDGSDADESDEEVENTPVKVIESGIKKMMSDNETVHAGFISDENTAIAALSMCHKFVSQIEAKIKKSQGCSNENDAEKLKKAKHFFNNLLIIQQILDVYPSAVKENAAKAVKQKEKVQPMQAVTSPISSPESDVNYPATSYPATSYPATSYPATSYPSTAYPTTAYPQQVQYSQADYSQYGYTAEQYHQYQEYMNSQANMTNFAAGKALSSTPDNTAVDPRKSKQAEGYSLYSQNVDEAGLEWYRKNKVGKLDL